MSRIIILISIIPTILAIVARKMFCDRGLGKVVGVETSRTGQELAERLLEKAGVKGKVEIVQKRRAEVKIGARAQLSLPKRLSESKSAIALGEVSLLCGHAVVATQNPDLLKWRQWAVRFSWAFPVFTLVVLVFAMVVGRMPVHWGLAVALASLGVGSLMVLLSLQVEIQASRMMATLVDEAGLLPTIRECEAVGIACRAYAYRQAVPGAVEWLMGKDMERKIAKQVGKRVARKVGL